MKNIRAYKDYLVAEELFSEAGITSDFTSFVADYASQHIKQDNKVGSLINFFAPAVISKMFSSLGFPILGPLLGMATSVFHIDIFEIISNVFSKLKPKVLEEKQFTSSEINEAVSSAIGEHSQVKESNNFIRKTKFLKLALKKESKILPSKTDFISIVSSVIGWLFKTAFAAAGFMVAGDIANHLVNRPNALDHNLKDKPEDKPEVQAPVITSKQTKFKLNPSYQDVKKANWSENILNTPESIQNMLLGFAKEVYQGLNNLDSVILSSPNFQLLKSRISFYNKSSEGDNAVEIPSYMKSKKQVVDFFIDDVAANSP